MIKQEFVLNLYQELEKIGLIIWLDGGWGVDALLGAQSRPHDDLDIVIEEKNLSALLRYLTPLGFKNVPRDDTSEWNFVLGDADDNRIDVHVINFDHDGRGIYGPVERGVYYPIGSLDGIGIIDNIRVRCLTPEYQVESHTGYTIKESDISDVVALCNKFNIELPDAYKDLV